MYSVYINHYKEGNTIVDTKTLMFTVPQGGKFPITRPMVKSSEDNADNFSFSMESNSPYYDKLLPLKTVFTVEYGEGNDIDIIFEGRVRSISTSSLLHTKSVTCEGVYAYMNDSFYEGVQEKHRIKITPDDYYTKIISNHNTMVPEKAIQRGTVGVTLPTETKKYEPTGWTQTTSLVNEMTSNFGGHMKIRYTNNGSYLDWYKYYSRDLGEGLRPSVTVGKNILDISSDQNVGEIFTRVIPIGGTTGSGQTIYIDGCKYTDKDGNEHTHSGKDFPISLIRQLYTDNELTDEFHSYTDFRDAESKFGKIYHTMSFSEANTQEKLWDKVKKWIKDGYYALAPSFTIKAIDLYIVDQDIPKILIGECVDVNYPIMKENGIEWEKRKLICKNVSYDLFNPENNSYTFGVPSDLLEETKRTSSKIKASENVGASSRAPSKGTDDVDLTFGSIARMIAVDYQFEAQGWGGTDAYHSFEANGELSGTVKCYDPEQVPAGSTALEHPEIWFDAELVGKITLPGKSIKWIAVAPDRGVLVYVLSDYVSSLERFKMVFAVKHWYTQKKGYKYQPTAPGVSTFETIAQMIEKDPSATYGGTEHATQFRNNKEISLTMKVWDPGTHDSYTEPNAQFNAKVIGKFGTNPLIYVAQSEEYGTFAFSYGSSMPRPVEHYYMRAKGNGYDEKNNLVSAENGEVYATNDGSPDGEKTVDIAPQEETGQGSEGVVRVGRDITGTGDKWKIKLNTPITYSDAEGHSQTKDGFVSASDFNISEIPSFKTKLGVFDVVIAGKVDAVDIEADLAYIRQISSERIYSDTSVYADVIGSNSLTTTNGWINHLGTEDIYAETSIQTPTITSANYLYPFSATESRHVDACLYDLSASESGGVITITGTRLNGSAAAVANFNMAATQFYIDAIAAAKDTGWNDARDIVIDSLPTTSNFQRNLDTNWPIYIPRAGYCSLNATYNISASGLMDYTKDGTTYKVINITVADKVAYRKHIPLQDAGTKTPGSSDKTITPDSGYYGISKVVVKGDSDLKAENIKKDVSIFDVTGTYEPALQNAGTKTPGTSNIVVTPGEGYYGLSKVTIAGDADLKAENIKKDVSIFGVTGTLESGGSSIDPSTDIQIDSYTNTSDEPSYGVLAKNMRDTILACINNGNWFSFKVHINGVAGQKYYKLDFTS